MLRIQRPHTPVPAQVGSMFSEHVSDDLLWAVIKQGQPLDAKYVEHARECRDCRDFISEFSSEARGSGFSFPDLSSTQMTAKATETVRAALNPLSGL